MIRYLFSQTTFQIFNAETMKAILSILLLAALMSCNSSEQKKYPLSVVQKNGKGITADYIFLYCDSASMISKTEAVAYRDGIKIRVFADQVSIHNNTYVK